MKLFMLALVVSISLVDTALFSSSKVKEIPKVPEVTYAQLIESVSKWLPGTNLREVFTFDITTVENVGIDWETILTHNRSNLNLESLNVLLKMFSQQVQDVVKNQESMPVLMAAIKGNIKSMNPDAKFPCDNCIPDSLAPERANLITRAVNTLKSKRVFLKKQIVQKFEAVRGLQSTYIEKRQSYIEKVREGSGGITKLNAPIKIPPLVFGAKNHAIEVLKFQNPYVYALKNLLEVAKCLVHDRNLLVEIILGTANELPAQQSIQFYVENKAGEFALVATSP